MACVGVLCGHRSVVYSVLAVTINGAEWLASGSMDQAVCLWDLSKLPLVERTADTPAASGPQQLASQPAAPPPATELRPRVLRGHKGWTTSLAWLKEDGLLASGSADNSIRLWRLEPPSEAAGAPIEYADWASCSAAAPEPEPSQEAPCHVVTGHAANTG